jgi:hypothetical protein
MKRQKIELANLLTLYRDSLVGKFFVVFKDEEVFFSLSFFDSHFVHLCGIQHILDGIPNSSNGFANAPDGKAEAIVGNKEKPESEGKAVVSQNNFGAENKDYGSLDAVKTLCESESMKYGWLCLRLNGVPTVVEGSRNGANDELDGIAEDAIVESAKILGEALNGKDIDSIFYSIADVAPQRPHSAVFR